MGAWAARTTQAIASGRAEGVSDPQENSEHRSGGGARRRPPNIGAEQSDNFEAPAGPDGQGFDVALTLTSDALTGLVGRALLPVLYAWGVVLVLGTGADILSAQSDNIGAPGVREHDKVVPAVGLRQLVHGHDLLGHELHHHLRERGAAHAPALQQGPHPLAARQLVRISGSAGSRTAGTSAPRRASTSRASGR